MTISDFKNIAKVSLFNQGAIKGMKYYIYDWAIYIYSDKMQNATYKAYYLNGVEISKDQFLKSLN